MESMFRVSSGSIGAARAACTALLRIHCDTHIELLWLVKREHLTNCGSANKILDFEMSSELNLYVEVFSSRAFVMKIYNVTQFLMMFNKAYLFF